MPTNESATPEEIQEQLDALLRASRACDQAEEDERRCIRYGTPQNKRVAFLRKQEAYERYLAINDWLLAHTEHGFEYDEESRTFRLRQPRNVP